MLGAERLLFNAICIHGVFSFGLMYFSRARAYHRDFGPLLTQSSAPCRQEQGVHRRSLHNLYIA
ncbi:hypothetical protein BDR03DRAFT_298660 [Suillus americanus]|nr:hypothetical protein BDR03DRAFT_298660 [Suillus americanus]